MFLPEGFGERESSHMDMVNPECANSSGVFSIGCWLKSMCVYFISISIYVCVANKEANGNHQKTMEWSDCKKSYLL